MPTNPPHRGAFGRSHVNGLNPSDMSPKGRALWLARQGLIGWTLYSAPEQLRINKAIVGMAEDRKRTYDFIQEIKEMIGVAMENPSREKADFTLGTIVADIDAKFSKKDNVPPESAPPAAAEPNATLAAVQNPDPATSPIATTKDQIMPAVAKMLEKAGLYMGGSTRNPAALIPLIVAAGKVYSMKAAAELDPSRFTDDLTITGPIDPNPIPHE